MKRIHYICSFFVGVSLLAACSKKSDPTPTPPSKQYAKVSFTNACISSDKIKMRANNTTLSAELSFLATSGYQDIDPGVVKVEFILPSSNLLIAESTQNLSANNYYSAYATGVITGPTMYFTTDNLTAPASGKAKVRFVNLSPDNLKEVVYVGDVKIDSNIAYPQATGYVEINAGTFTIVTQEPNNTPSVRILQNKVFASGGIYTILLTGKKGATGSADLALSIQENKR